VRVQPKEGRGGNTTVSWEGWHLVGTQETADKCTIPPLLPCCNARAAHMVLKGVSAPSVTHSHNKETRLPEAASPRRTQEAQWTRSVPGPTDRPPVSVAARELSLVGAGVRGPGAGKGPAGRQAARELGGARGTHGGAASTAI
jgi:hypothetical protein